MIVNEVFLGYSDSKFDWNSSNREPLECAIKQYPSISANGVEGFDRGMYAIGGSDAKGIVLVLGVDRVPTKAAKIRDKVKTALKPKIWIPPLENITKYLKTSYGATQTAYELRQEGGVYYVTSIRAEEQTKPAAARLVKYSAENLIPALSIFGDINASGDFGHRSYIDRTALLLSLNKGDSFVAKLARDLAIGKKPIAEGFEAFKSVGLVEYDSVNTEEEGWVIYEKVEGKEFGSTKGVGRLQKNLIEYFKANEKGNTQAIAAALGRVDQLDLIDLLSGFVEEGFLRRADWHGSVVQSDAKITPAGKDFVAGVLVPILELYSGSKDRKLDFKQIFDEVTKSPTLASTALASYREKYPRIPTSKTGDAVVEAIQAAGPQRASEIIEQFGSRAEPVLRKLVDSGTLTNVRRGKASFYMLLGMSLPEPQKITVSIDYQVPVELIPPTGYSPEHYTKQLNGLEFWETLIKELAELPEQVYTESYFYRYFDPNDLDWHQSTASMRERSQHKSGKYTTYVEALKKAGVKNPFSHLRDFRSDSEVSELKGMIEKAQVLIREKLKITQER